MRLSKYQCPFGPNFVLGLSPAAWFRADTGVTVTGQGASMVADQADSDNALVLPGVAGNYASAPDSVPLSITGDIDIRVRVALDDWTPTASSVLVAKDDALTNRDYIFDVHTTGALRFYYSADGSGAGLKIATASSATGIADGASQWVRATYASATGKVNFYLGGSETIPTWVALGTEQTITAASIHDGTTAVTVGAIGNGTAQAAGKLYRASIYSTIGGTTPVFDANFAAQTKGTTSFSESSSNAATVTVNQSGALPAHIGNQKDLLQGTDASRPPYLSYSGTKYLYLPGVAGNTATTPDSVAASVAGDFSIVVDLSMPDWTPAAASTLFAHSTSFAAGIAWALQMSSGGVPILYSSADGTTLLTHSATSATGFTDGDRKMIAAYMDVNDGGGNRVVKFYTSSDSGATWTQLGNTVTTAGATTIFDSTAVISVGSTANNTQPAAANIYRAQLWSGDFQSGGTKVLDFNAADGTDAASSFVSSTTGETWTVNSSGGLPAQIVGRPSLLFDGTADYLKCNAFTLNQPETVYIAFKQVSWTLNKPIYDGEATNSGILYQSATTPRIRFSSDGGVNTTAENANLAIGTYGVVCAVANGATSLVQVNNGTAATGNGGAGNMGGFTLGRLGATATNGNIQVIECLIFPSAHDATQRARVIQYLAGRHGIAL